MLSKKNNKKGFTLMEMLIVVAIIAVLIAIAIPTFTNSLNKARVATDEANIRSGYASVIADVLTNNFDVEGTDTTTTVTYTLNKDGSVTKQGETGGDAYVCLGNAADDVEIAGINVTKWTKGATPVTYTYNYDTNAVTISAGTTTQP